jgi:hypothetical protein
VEDKSPDQLLREGLDSIVYLIKHQVIDRDTVEILLSGMLAGYVDYIIEQQLGDATTELVAHVFANSKQSSNG